jgi:predicted 3-demethylubiquinone-9 3-methyltransferase (glyoxalase superfamily)
VVVGEVRLEDHVEVRFAEDNDVIQAVAPNGAHEALKDRYGLSWQVNPTILGEVLADPDPAKSKRAMEAMLKM